MAKTLKELRSERKRLNKHVVVIKLTNGEEEKLVKRLEEGRLDFSTFVNELVRKEIQQ